jgi:hypothetical protein
MHVREVSVPVPADLLMKTFSLESGKELKVECSNRHGIERDPNQKK